MEKRDKQLVLVGTLPPQVGGRNLGGVANVVYNEAQQLASKGGMTFCVLGIGRYYKRFQRINGIDIVGPNFNPVILVNAVAYTWRFRRKVRGTGWREHVRFLLAIFSLLSLRYAEFRFGLLHVHHVHNQIIHAAEVVFPGVRVVATIHSYHELMNASGRRHRQVLKNQNDQLSCAARLTHVSEAVRQQGQALGVKWSCPDEVIYNGIEQLDVEQASDGADVLFVGSLIERKRPNDLVRASLQTKPAPVTVAFAGIGPLEDELRMLAVNQGAMASFLGHLDRQRVFSAMANAGVMVVPSTSESFGLVYLEALMVGTPAIGYEPVIEELRGQLDLSSLPAGWLLGHDPSTDTVSDLAGKISIALQLKQSQRYDEDRQIVRDSIESRFSWESIVDDYRGLFEGMLLE